MRWQIRVVEECGADSSSRCGSNVDGQGGAAAAVRVSARDGAAAPILRSTARGESVSYKAAAVAAAAAAKTTTTGWCKTIATKFSTAVIADVVVGVAFVEAFEASRSCGQNGRAGIRD